MSDQLRRLGISTAEADAFTSVVRSVHEQMQGISLATQPIRADLAALASAVAGPLEAMRNQMGAIRLASGISEELGRIALATQPIHAQIEGIMASVAPLGATLTSLSDQLRTPFSVAEHAELQRGFSAIANFGREINRSVAITSDFGELGRTINAARPVWESASRASELLRSVHRLDTGIRKLTDSVQYGSWLSNVNSLSTSVALLAESARSNVGLLTPFENPAAGASFAWTGDDPFGHHVAALFRAENSEAVGSPVIVELEILCAGCGSPFDFAGEFRWVGRRGFGTLTVTPFCKTCLDDTVADPQLREQLKERLEPNVSRELHLIRGEGEGTGQTGDGSHLRLVEVKADDDDEDGSA